MVEPNSLGRTPAVLRAIGVPELSIIITRDVIRKVTNPTSRDHNVPMEAIEQLVAEEFAEPLLIFDGGKSFSSRVIATEQKTQGDRRRL